MVFKPGSTNQPPGNKNPGHNAFHIDKIVVGLGNPGTKYSGTRHNLGFRALDNFLALDGIKKYFRRKGKSRIQLIDFHGLKVLLVKPSAFMNLSGSALESILRGSNIEIENMLVIHDEMDLLPGTAKMKIGGSAAGHRGIESIIELCGDRFTRLKIGIGKPEGDDKNASISWVLGRMDDYDEDKIEQIMPRIADAIKGWILDGPEKTMNWFNANSSQTANEETD